MCDVSPIVKKYFDKFIKEVSLRYDIPKKDINSLLAPKQKPPVKEIPSLGDLCLMSRPELVAICKQHSVLTTGSKEIIICRIAKINSDKYKVEVKKVMPKFKKNAEVLSVVKKYIPIINVSRNQWGNYEHKDTGLVFNQDHLIYAKQIKDGTLVNLTPDDIETCKQYKFEWVLPENLNWNKKSLDDVKIEELDDEIFESEGEEEDEECNDSDDE
jgi:hypothetical protein